MCPPYLATHCTLVALGDKDHFVIVNTTIRCAVTPPLAGMVEITVALRDEIGKCTDTRGEGKRRYLRVADSHFVQDSL